MDAERHLQHLGLTRHPFPPTPDAGRYFYTAHLEQEFAEALHCLLARKGFVLLSGEVGLGKSTFLRRLIEALHGEGACVALVLNTFLQGTDLLNAINRDFGLVPSANFADSLETLNQFLLERHLAGSPCVLLIDDAQNLSLESLELVRLLTNLETGQHKLLQIVLAGQPELQDSLARPQIRQLASRIVKHLHLGPLSSEELGRYVAFRLGDETGVRLSADGLRELRACSGGNPRRIHLIMDRCLYGVLLRDDGLIDARLVATAAAEAGFRRAPRRRAASSRRKRLLAPALAAGLLLGVGGLLGWSLLVPPALAGRAMAVVAPAPAAEPAVAPAPALAPAAAIVTPSEPLALIEPTSLAGEAWARCQAQLATVEPAPALRSLRVPQAQLTAVLAGDACLLDAQEPALVLWRPSLRGEWITSPHANPEALRLQTLLGALALYPGELDGRWGPVTRAALSDFQIRQGLSPSGIPDDLTLSLLPVLAAPAAPERSEEQEHGEG